MRRYIYDETKITALVMLVNKIEVKGIEQAKILVSITNILDDGIEENEKEAENEKAVENEKAEE